MWQLFLTVIPVLFYAVKSIFGHVAMHTVKCGSLIQCSMVCLCVSAFAKMTEPTRMLFGCGFLVTHGTMY